MDQPPFKLMDLGVVSVTVGPKGELGWQISSLRGPAEAAQLFTNQYGSGSIF